MEKYIENWRNYTKIIEYWTGLRYYKSAHIPCWRATLINRTFIAINSTPVENLQNITPAITATRTTTAESINFTFLPVERIDNFLDNNIPMIHFDQLNVMVYKHQATIINTTPWMDPYTPPPVDGAMVFAVMDRGGMKSNLTQDYLQKQDRWIDWLSF